VKKPPKWEVFSKKGQKGGLSETGFDGDSGIGKKFNTSNGFCKGDKRN
jgi:hypothetical protein